MSQKTKRTKLPHKVIVKAPGLLPMLYKVRELAGELGIPESTLRDWLKRSAPHYRDKGHLWIYGPEFSDWVKANRKQKREKRLSDTQAYCFICKADIEIVNPKIVPIKGELVSIKGTCPICRGKVSRGARKNVAPS